MQFITEQIGKITQVKITGRIDAVCADDLQAFLSTLFTNDQIYLVIDCSDVMFLSSAGMRAFLNSMSETEKKGGKIVFSGFKARIEEVIRLTGLTKCFIHYVSLEEAMQELFILIDKEQGSN
jgi:anti-sigma B factor antagonist